MDISSRRNRYPLAKKIERNYTNLDYIRTLFFVTWSYCIKYQMFLMTWGQT